MMPLLLDYASPSAYLADRTAATLGLSANGRRPVRFHGRVTHGVLQLRLALQALGDVIWSDDTWLSIGAYSASMDPVITVHPDRVWMEAFSQDQSAYAAVVCSRTMFETEGTVTTGTTNVDFTAWLWAALAQMRSSRQTWLRVDVQGLEVSTVGAGGRFEQKVDLPEPWVRGFLQVQSAMAMPGTRLRIRPVDLLAAIRFLKVTKARLSPRALRYEFEPGQDARLVLEPWEQVIPLVGAEHSYAEPRVVRTWGRRRLRLLETLLPYADGVDVYLKGRAMPSFYAVHLGEVTFVLGLSGWSENGFRNAAGLDLLASQQKTDPALVEKTQGLLAEKYTLKVDQLAAALAVDMATAAALLHQCVRSAQAMYDVEARAWRHRPLFEEPIDVDRFYPVDERVEAAERLLQANLVTTQSCTPRQTLKVRRLPTPDGHVHRTVIHWDWQVNGAAAEEQVELVVTQEDRIIFGVCTCAFFKEHILARGPCSHMLALFMATADQRRDLPTSEEAQAPVSETRAGPDDAEADEEDNGSEDE